MHDWINNTINVNLSDLNGRITSSGSNTTDQMRVATNGIINSSAWNRTVGIIETTNHSDIVKIYNNISVLGTNYGGSNEWAEFEGSTTFAHAAGYFNMSSINIKHNGENKIMIGLADASNLAAAPQDTLSVPIIAVIQDDNDLSSLIGIYYKNSTGDIYGVSQYGSDLDLGSSPGIFNALAGGDFNIYGDTSGNKAWNINSDYNYDMQIGTMGLAITPNIKAYNSTGDQTLFFNSTNGKLDTKNICIDYDCIASWDAVNLSGAGNTTQQMIDAVNETALNLSNAFGYNIDIEYTNYLGSDFTLTDGDLKRNVTATADQVIVDNLILIPELDYNVTAGVVVIYPALYDSQRVTLYSNTNNAYANYLGSGCSGSTGDTNRALTTGLNEQVVVDNLMLQRNYDYSSNLTHVKFLVPIYDNQRITVWG